MVILRRTGGRRASGRRVSTKKAPPDNPPLRLMHARIAGGQTAVTARVASRDRVFRPFSSAILEAWKPRTSKAMGSAAYD
jgi:hypothetical protein